MESLGVDVSSFLDKAEELRSDGQTVMYIAVDRSLAGLIGVSDPLKLLQRKLLNLP